MKMYILTLLLATGVSGVLAMEEKVAVSSWDKLLSAINENNAEVAKKLLDTDPTLIHETDKIGMTALIAAASRGNYALAKMLIDKRAGVDGQIAHGGHKGRTALYFAAGGGYTDIVEMLSDADADVDMQASNGLTALHIAAKNGHTDTVQMLIDKGADVKIQGVAGHTALFLAVQNDHTDIVGRLIEAGADMNKPLIKGAKGMTPLMFAANQSYKEIVLVLLGHGQEVLDLRDVAAAHTMAQIGGAKEIEKILRDELDKRILLGKVM